MVEIISKEISTSTNGIALEVFIKQNYLLEKLVGKEVSPEHKYFRSTMKLYFTMEHKDLNDFKTFIQTNENIDLTVEGLSNLTAFFSENGNQEIVEMIEQAEVKNGAFIKQTEVSEMWEDGIN